MCSSCERSTGTTCANREPFGVPAHTYMTCTIRPDGSGMQRLTDDGRSFGPRWTSTGQLAFVRGGWNWLMDAGGGNATRLDFDLDQLTAAGCVIC